MKLRIRLQTRTKTLDLGDVQPKDVTLENLKQSVTVEFNLEEIPFNLSLNKADVLEGDDTVLSEFGIVGGDLIHVMSDQEIPSLNEPEPKRISLENVAEKSEPLVMDTKDEPSTSDSCSSTGASACQPSCEPNDPVVNRCLREPMQCYESTESSVPGTLVHLYDSVSDHDSSDLLMIVIHALALESGLRPVLENHDSCSMPENWRQTAFYNIKYRLPESGDVMSSVTGVVMGSFLVVHGSIIGQEDDHTFKSIVKPADYIKENTSGGAAQCYKNLRQLSRTIKNQICLPILRELRTELGYPTGVNLMSLTHEIKLKIVGYLDCGSILRLDQTCQHFHCVARDKAVWRRRYLLDFGSRGDNHLSQNWYQMYKRQYMLRKEQRKAMREWTFLTPGQVWMQPRPHSPFSPLAPYNGGIIGGDYDLNPQYHGIPDPLGRRGHNPLQPLRPRPRMDPFGPLPEHNIFPGLGRGRRGGGWMGGFGGPRMF